MQPLCLCPNAQVVILIVIAACCDLDYQRPKQLFTKPAPATVLQDQLAAQQAQIGELQERCVTSQACLCITMRASRLPADGNPILLACLHLPRRRPSWHPAQEQAVPPPPPQARQQHAAAAAAGSAPTAAPGRASCVSAQAASPSTSAQPTASAATGRCTRPSAKRCSGGERQQARTAVQPQRAAEQLPGRFRKRGALLHYYKANVLRWYQLCERLLLVQGVKTQERQGEGQSQRKRAVGAMHCRSWLLQGGKDTRMQVTR